jgi:hypothetical protein
VEKERNGEDMKKEEKNRSENLKTGKPRFHMGVSTLI